MWRLQAGELPPTLQSKVFWVLIGTNDLAHSECYDDAVYMGIIGVVEYIQQQRPGSIIVVNSLLPRRDATLVDEARDLERQLAAALADLELSRKDYERAVMSNENLQSALESFQVEREAELSLLEEQRKHSEATLAAAHAAGIEAINEVNEARVKEVQLAADSAIRNLMEEIKVLEASIEVSTRLGRIFIDTYT